MAEIIDLAELVKDSLNTASLAGEFSQTFTAEREFVPLYELQDLGTLHVTVVPRSIAGELMDRSKFFVEDYGIDVAVQQRVPGLVQREIDKLMSLVEELRDYLILNPPSGFQALGFTNDPIYDPQHLAEMRQFTSVNTISYRQGRRPG